MSRFDRFLDDPNATVEAPAAAAPAPSSNRFEQFISDPAPPQPKPQRQPNQPFGELRPAEYNWRETIGNMAQDALIKLGAKPYVAGRVGRGAVDAASLAPPVGATISGLDLGHYATRGQPLRAGIEALGVIPGAQALRRGMFGMPQRAMAPDTQQLGRAADVAYDAWRTSPVRYDPGMMDDVTNEIARTLTQRGANRELAPQQWAALEAGRGLKTQTGMTNDQFETLRRQLRGGQSREQRAAGEEAVDVLENYLANPPAQFVRTGTPQQIAADRANLLAGRGNTAAQKRSELLEGYAEAAKVRSEGGQGFAEPYRGSITSMLAADAKNTAKGRRSALAGFSPEEQAAVREQVAGSLTERALQSGGKAAQRVGSAIATGGGALGGGALLVPQVSPALTSLGIDPLTASGVALAGGAGLNAAGRLAGRGADDMAQRAAADLAARMRMRSPLAERSGRFGMITDPNAVRRDAGVYAAFPWLREKAEEGYDALNTPFANR